jgi:hypothetical protein
MSKKIVIILIIVLLAAAGVVGYFMYDKAEAAEHEVQLTLNAIPENAGLIIRAKNPFDKWTQLKGKGEYWKDLQGIPAFAKLDSQINYFQMQFTANPKLRALVQNEPAFLSLHMAGLHECNVLFSFSCKDASVVGEFQKMMNRNDSIKVFQRPYDGVVIYQNSQLSNGKQYSLALTNGILVVSESMILVEDAIRSIKHGSPLLQNASFMKVFKAADPSADANIFINFKRLPDMLSLVVNQLFAKELKMFGGFGSWSESDLRIKPEGMAFTGMAYEPDSINSYLKLFADQTPQKINVTNFLPDNTAFFLYYGIDDFDKFSKGYRNYLSGNKSLFDFEKTLATLSASTNIDIEEDIFSWLGKEICLAYAQSNSEDFKQNAYLILRTTDMEAADAKLKEIQSKSNPAAEIIEFQKYKIENLGLTDFFPKIFGNLASSITNSFYVEIDEYVIFANEAGALKHFINSYMGGKILAKNANFIQFMEQFSENTNVMTYFNFKRSNNLWKTFSSPEMYKEMEAYVDTIAKFECFGYQLNVNGNYFATNAYLKYNPKKDLKSSGLVETLLDSTFTFRPQVASNHLTKEKEIILQDDAHNLYLMNKGGEILWKRNLGEKILGKIHQVDCYKNGKLQYLFNTATKLYLVDRNGGDVKGFPVSLVGKACAGLSLMDYENNKSYRILIPFTNGKVLNYDIYGKQIKGFEFSGMPAEIRTPLTYMTFDKKDYIVVVDIQGNIKVIGRKGEEKAKIKGKVPKSKMNDYTILTGKTFEKSAVVNTDNAGTLNILYFDGTSQKISFKSCDANHKWYLFDVNKDGEDDVIYFDANTIEAYQMNKTEIFTLETGDADLRSRVYFDMLPNETFRMGFADYAKNKVFLSDNGGNIIDGFPIDASSPYLIEDLDGDGSGEIIVGDNLGNIYFFPLQ